MHMKVLQDRHVLQAGGPREYSESCIAFIPKPGQILLARLGVPEKLSFSTDVLHMLIALYIQGLY